MLHRQIKRMESALVPHLVPDADVQRLLRIPGIGKACAFSIRLEVDDIARFASDRAFFSYCRLVPGADNSGDRVRHKRSRDGNRYLKLAFSHAAVRAIQYYPEVRAPTYRRWVGYGTKKRRKPDVVARALVAKELARIVYHMLRKQQDFNGQFKGKPLSRLKKELPARLGGAGPLLASPASRTGDGEGTQPESARPPSAGMGSEAGAAPGPACRPKRSGTTGAEPVRGRERSREPVWGCGPPALREAADEDRTDLALWRRCSKPRAPQTGGCRARLALPYQKRLT